MPFHVQKRCIGEVVAEFVLPIFVTRPGKECVFLAERQFTHVSQQAGVKQCLAEKASGISGQPDNFFFSLRCAGYGLPRRCYC